MGRLTFSLNVTLDGCVDHQEGVADEEIHAFFTRLMDAARAMLRGRTTHERMERYRPAVARGRIQARPAVPEWGQAGEPTQVRRVVDTVDLHVEQQPPRCR